jgi:diguanylate cyclase (GGDEF)-like protein
MKDPQPRPIPRPAVPAAPPPSAPPPSALPTSAPPGTGIDAGAIGAALFAWEWARALSGTSWVAADRTVIADRLRGMTCRLVEALATEPFAPATGIAVGEELVEIGFAAPDALARTVTLLTHRFLVDLGLINADLNQDSGGSEDDAARRETLAELIGMVCLGFVRAVRDRTLGEQEAIRSSALLAWQRARADQQEYALRDPLTGLLNRQGFTARLEQVIRHSPPGVVGACLLSVDGFDALDRGLGRDVGNRLLATVARRLAAACGGRNELVARIRRSEFIVAGLDGIDPDRPDDTAAQRLDVAQRAIGEPIVLDDRQIVLSASAGLLARPSAGSHPHLIVQDADLAASWARSRGPGGVAVFDGVRAARQVSDLALTADLPAAIEDGLLLPHYQPIVSLSSGRIEAVEALARWPHAEHGVLTPDRFLGLAEEGGLIATLGRAVLRQACVQGQTWQLGLERPPVVAVNLAAAQLADRQTVGDVVTVLEQTGLPPELLQLEITEHAALDEPGTLSVIRDLAGYGVGMVLDDFGTGRAHLAQLPELPAHGVGTLKLPADFLRQPTAGDSPRVWVLAAMIRLAHELGMRVTVEGVETSAHDALVRELGADLAQGSHYAPAGTAAAIGQLLVADQR